MLLSKGEHWKVRGLFRQRSKLFFNVIFKTISKRFPIPTTFISLVTLIAHWGTAIALFDVKQFVVVRMNNVQEQFLSVRRNEPTGTKPDTQPLLASGTRHIGQLWRVPVWASPELHGNQWSGAIFHRCSDFCWLLWWFNLDHAKPLRPRGWNRVYHFGWWKGLKVGPMTSWISRTTGVKSTVQWIRAPYKIPWVRLMIAKRPSWSEASTRFYSY